MSPKLDPKFVAPLSPEDMASLLAVANDLAIVIDSNGVVRDVAADQGIASVYGSNDWVGKHWADTVTVESRPKIEALMNGDAEGGRWRQVNHPVGDGPDIPVMYRAFRVGDSNHTIAMGRDLRPMSNLQQQLLDVQHSMERDYARLYQAETRYRMLFQMASEAILIVDAGDRTIVEANPAAAKALDRPIEALVGGPLMGNFPANIAEQVGELLATVRAGGKAPEAIVELRDGECFELTATVLRREEATLFLVHLSPVGGDPERQENGMAGTMLDLVERSPDGFVVTDPQGRILAANEAFLNFCQVASEVQLRNQPLDQWLGRPGVDVNVLRKNLRQRGVIRQFPTRLNPQFGTPLDVEVAAVAATEAETPCFGFVIRRIIRRREGELDIAAAPLGRSMDQMADLVGRVPLKELVREATDMIERMCIEAALRLTTNNRASAAEMLGLSRQSLYVKLRRYNIGESGPEPLENDVPPDA